MNIEQMLRQTDSLTFLNALKVGMAELKEELSVIDETREYMDQAVERARKIMRRMDNQYRAIVKSVQVASEPKTGVTVEDPPNLDELLENY